jgi:hypothetical protein
MLSYNNLQWKIFNPYFLGEESKLKKVSTFLKVYDHVLSKKSMFLRFVFDKIFSGKCP